MTIDYVGRGVFRAFTVNVDRSVRAGYVSLESRRELAEGFADASPLQRVSELLRAHFLVLRIKMRLALAGWLAGWAGLESE